MGDTYHCKGKCGAQRVFSTIDPHKPALGDDRRWTCAKCVALRQARATTYAKRAKLSGHYGGGSQIVTNPCPTCGTQMDTSLCMFCSQQAIGKALRHTMRGTVAKDKAGRITGAQVAKWFASMPQPDTDMIMPIEPGSTLGKLLDTPEDVNHPSYRRCPDHPGDYGANCSRCEMDRERYREEKK